MELSVAPKRNEIALRVVQVRWYHKIIDRIYLNRYRNMLTLCEMAIPVKLLIDGQGKVYVFNGIPAFGVKNKMVSINL